MGRKGAETSGSADAASVGADLAPLDRHLLQSLQKPVLDRWAGKLEVRRTQLDTVGGFVQTGNAAVVPVMLRWMQSRHPVVRLEAATAVASLGMDQFTDLVSGWIRGDDLAAAHGAIWGSKLAEIRKHLSGSAKRRIWADLLPILMGERRLARTEAGADVIDAAVKAALQLDRAAAIRLFMGPRCLHPRNNSARSVLWEIYSMREGNVRAASRPINSAMLWPVYEAARAGKLRDGRDPDCEQLTGLLLTFTADTDPLRTRAEVRRVLEETKEKEWSQLREFAKEATRRCRGVPEPQAAYNRMIRNPEGVSEKAAMVLRAYELATHVSTDGLATYFHNLGPHWRSAQAGLRSLALPRAASLLGQAAEILEAHGPLNTLRHCQRAFGRLTDAESAALESLGEKFDAMNDTLFRKIQQYIAKHPEDL